MSGGIAPVPDGPVGHGTNSWAAAADSQLQVLGSAIDADTYELLGLARKVDAVADSVAEAAGRVAAARRAIAGSTPWAPTSGRYAQSECHLGQLSLLAMRAQATELAGSLRVAADAYEEAEAAARRSFVLRVPRAPIRIFGLELANPLRLFGVVHVSRYATAMRGQVTPSDPQFGYLLEELAWGVTGGGLYPDWAPMADDRSRLLATVTSSAIAWGLAIPRGLNPTQAAIHRIVPAPDPARPSGVVNAHGASGIEDISAGISDLYYGGTVPGGTIRLDRVTGADGSVCWQLYIPGTQTQVEEAGQIANPANPLTWPLAASTAVVNRNPFDWQTNTQVFSGRANAVQDGVVAALAAAGVGPHEPVLIAGHSQGAMMSMAVASDPRVQQHYDVQSVVTLGGPVGDMDVPDGIAVMNVEHVDDLVSGLDNAPNPVEPDRVTVRRDIAASTDPADAGVQSVREAHDLPAYLRTGAMIDASGEPAIASWRAQSASVLAGEDALVQSQYYQLERESLW